MSDPFGVATPEQAFDAVGYWLAVDGFLNTVTQPDGVISFSGMGRQYHEQLVGLFDEHELAEIEAEDLMRDRHPEVGPAIVDAAGQFAGHISRASAILEVMGETNGDPQFERLGMLDNVARDTILGMIVEIKSVAE